MQNVYHFSKFRGFMPVKNYPIFLICEFAPPFEKNTSFFREMGTWMHDLERAHQRFRLNQACHLLGTHDAYFVLYPTEQTSAQFNVHVFPHKNMNLKLSSAKWR